MGRLKTIGYTNEEDGIATTAKKVSSVDFKKCNFFEQGERDRAGALK